MSKVFFSYSHTDEALRNEFQKHLAMLVSDGSISTWHDRMLSAGDKLDDEIDAHLAESQVILLLISSDFLASGYCYDIEFKRAMELQRQGKARVIPVILKACDWRSSPDLASLLAVPTDAKPVTKWTDRDEAWLDVVQQIRRTLPAKRTPLEDLSGNQSTPTIGIPRGPRSSNLSVKKEFTDADRDTFLDGAFEYIARFFENSLDELKRRQPNLQTRFKQPDGRTFTADIYKDGRSVTRCTIRHSEGQGFGDCITYSRGEASERGINEMLRVEASHHSLALAPSGMGLGWNDQSKAPLTLDGAAEYYWSMLIEPLQR